MTDKNKTLSPFWGRSCPYFGDGLLYSCPHFGDALSQLWGRFRLFWSLACPNFGDILNNHTPNKTVRLSVTEQLTRPRAIPQRKVGEAAGLTLMMWSKLVPMALFEAGGETAVRGLPFSLPKKNGEGGAW